MMSARIFPPPCSLISMQTLSGHNLWEIPESSLSGHTCAESRLSVMRTSSPGDREGLGQPPPCPQEWASSGCAAVWLHEEFLNKGSDLPPALSQMPGRRHCPEPLFLSNRLSASVSGLPNLERRDGNSWEMQPQSFAAPLHHECRGVAGKLCPRSLLGETQALQLWEPLSSEVTWLPSRETHQKAVRTISIPGALQVLWTFHLSEFINQHNNSDIFAGWTLFSFLEKYEKSTYFPDIKTAADVQNSRKDKEGVLFYSKTTTILMACRLFHKLRDGQRMEKLRADHVCISASTSEGKKMQNLGSVCE